jgi:predicted nucleic acid-binding protein
MKAGAIKRFVLDASVAVAWCFEDEHAGLAETVLDLLSTNEAVTPAIWPLEVANALLVAERRKRITTVQVTGLLRRISNLPITIEPMPAERAFERVLSVARQQELTEYDAAYVELALREGLPLATLDLKLRRAAQTVGITLIE